MKKLVIHKKKGIYTMSFDDIVYMEKNLRKIKVLGKNESIEFYGRLSDIMTYLDCRFMYCHRSYIINMDKIVWMAANTIFVENNDGIYMGRGTYGRAKKIFRKYMNEKKACCSKET